MQLRSQWTRPALIGVGRDYFTNFDHLEWTDCTHSYFYYDQIFTSVMPSRVSDPGRRPCMGSWWQIIVGSFEMFVTHLFQLWQEPVRLPPMLYPSFQLTDIMYLSY